MDDGKSTLIGRLLLESRQIFEDQLEAVARDSVRHGTQGVAVDLALLVDGLQAEREQGITIDVAYRFFATPRRRFIVADTPGHEQYTRNMATGASTADLAILLVDARKGLLQQTRRHSRIVALLGVRHVVVAINKMDLVDWDRALFERIDGEYRALVDSFQFSTIAAIPVSALTGDNITQPSTRTPWYEGPPLLEYLETIDVTSHHATTAFRLPVQLVNRPRMDFRGFCGRVASGTVRVGDRVRVAPRGTESTVQSILLYDQQLPQAETGRSITLTLTDEVDVSRGDVITAAADPIEVRDQFQASLVWMSDQPLVAGRSYFLKIHAAQVSATITDIKSRIDVITGAPLAATELALNDIGVVNVSTGTPVPFEPYVRSRVLGGFILIDRITNATVGAGMIDFALRRAANVQWQTLSVGRAERAALKHQRPSCLWLTGLSGAGKSTIANLLDQRLYAEGRHTVVLDGDNVRHGLNRDLGFTTASRVENVRRVAEVAKLMVDAGLIVIVSLISPYRAERRFARSLFDPGDFLEVWIDTPIAECQRRDPKGLYAKADRGELANLSGVGSEYEAPEHAELRIDTSGRRPDDCAEEVLRILSRGSSVGQP